MARSQLRTQPPAAWPNRRMLERRSSRRCDLPLTLTIFPTATHTILAQQAGFPRGETCNLSSEGIYFITREAPAAGSALFFGLHLPAELTRDREMFVCAEGKVVRTEKKMKDGIERTGVAARIERYEIVKDDPLRFE
jgi:hypothetical protein